ncbi:MAG: DUF6439 family protein [cyanobacterium endosymbiont of Rhopalodia musculus]|uniref:DUF6439 family protein n=1 Tax=cyanobacterium endosymbiont of Epithemia clementina EcSB TaxID=3034674 RepID=UPI00247FE849|nr:DUF6439 family protein [cyanobacterium endosymbiont of Epithemia clementina EcSB]WGT67478.1 DUF6439 family protein [cyanobacterium endosymbiont of Epithemia clementina EcSB]
MSQITQVYNSGQARTISSIELAQALAEQLAITPNDWHRLKNDRKAQAQQQIASALVFLIKDQSQEALDHLNQAVGWLDRSISAFPCPGHGTSTRT